VKAEFPGADPSAWPVPLDPAPTVFHRFHGPRERWVTGARSWRGLAYRGLWPGIDLVFEARGRTLKYEFRVAPGADPALARIRFRGASAVRVGADGRLRVETPAGGIEDAAPVAWQEEPGGRRRPVEAAWDLAADGATAGFRLARVDPSLPLVLDPAIALSSGFLGGADADYAHAVAVDAAGNSYLTGEAVSPETSFPVTGGPDPAYNGGDTDAFVAKVDPSGTTLLYCGFVGGDAHDHGYGVAVDAAGAAYLALQTSSREDTFPVLGGPDLTYNGGIFDGAVAKVAPGGGALEWCGYLGGADFDQVYGIAVDGNGDVVVDGTTGSSDASFPVTVGPDLSYGGGQDAFVAKVRGDGSGLAWCGYVGGDDYERATGLALDPQGNAVLVGTTSSTEATFPVLVGPDLTFNGGGTDAFVARVRADGAGLLHCGYLGGAGGDSGIGAAIDTAGDILLSGFTNSGPDTLPVKVGPRLAYGGGFDALVAKVRGDGTDVVWCGYVGGAALDRGNNVAVDAAGNVWVAGQTASDETTFPVRAGPGLLFGGVTDAFVARVRGDGTRLDACGYLGGDLAESAIGLAVDGQGDAHVAGSVASSEATFPVIGGPEVSYGGNGDAFLVRVSAPAGEVVPTAGTITDSRCARRDRVTVRGTHPFGEADGGAGFDPAVDALTVAAGGLEDPVVVAVPAGDLRWKAHGTRWRWKAPRGAVPRATVDLDPERGTFSLAIAGFDFASPPGSPVQVLLEAGGVRACSLAPWDEVRPGVLRVP